MKKDFIEIMKEASGITADGVLLRVDSDQKEQQGRFLEKELKQTLQKITSKYIYDFLEAEVEISLEYGKDPDNLKGLLYNGLKLIEHSFNHFFENLAYELPNNLDKTIKRDLKHYLFLYGQEGMASIFYECIEKHENIRAAKRKPNRIRNGIKKALSKAIDELKTKVKELEEKTKEEKETKEGLSKLLSKYNVDNDIDKIINADIEVAEIENKIFTYYFDNTCNLTLIISDFFDDSFINQINVDMRKVVTGPVYFKERVEYSPF